MTSASSFRFRAIDSAGVSQSGDLVAPSRDAAAAVLSTRGLFLLALTPRRTPMRTRRSLPIHEVALALRMLATLLEAALPIGRALTIFAEIAPTSWQPLLPQLLQDVREGRTLADALDRIPARLPLSVIGVIRAGEASSRIAPAVYCAAEMLEREARVSSAIKSALAYPILLAVSGAASSLFLIGVVIPRFAEILGDLGQALPPSTRVALAIGDYVRHWGWLLPAIVLVFIVFLHFVHATPLARRQLHEVLLATPILGATRMARSTAQCANTLAALLESGVPLPAAISHTARASSDAAIAYRLSAAREEVLRGHPLSAGLLKHQAMTPIAIRLVRAGEESAAVPAMLMHAASVESARTDDTLRRLIRLLEPTLILGFGAIVALVASALLQAVYSVRPTL